MPRIQALRRAGALIVAVILSCCGVPEAQALEGTRQSHEIGFVSQMHGDWVDLPSGLHLRVGDRIYADSQLQRDATPTTDDHIAVTFHGVEQAVSYTCQDGLQCQAPIAPRLAWERQQPAAPQRGSSLILILRPLPKS